MFEAIPNSLIDELAASTAERRAAAVHALADWTVTTAAPPFDEVLALLRARAAIGPGAIESDPRVRKAAHEDKRRVAAARGAKRGLRAPLPADFHVLGDRVVWEGIAIVWDAVSIYGGRELLDSGLRTATLAQCDVYSVWWTQSEVRNGGFEQYFANSTCVVAPYAREGFARIGAGEIANALETAMTIFPACSTEDTRQRRTLLAKVPRGAFDACDKTLYEHVDASMSLAEQYVRANRDQFFE